jgi:hypothetical protein
MGAVAPKSNKTLTCVIISSSISNNNNNNTNNITMGYAVAQLVEALCYKPEGRGFDSLWHHWNFSLT